MMVNTNGEGDIFILYPRRVQYFGIDYNVSCSFQQIPFIRLRLPSVPDLLKAFIRKGC